MDRQTWTDERIDDMVDRLDNNANLLRGEMRELRADVARLGDRMDMFYDSMQHSMQRGFDSMHRQLVYVGFGLAGMIVAALVAVLAKTL